MRRKLIFGLILSATVACNHLNRGTDPSMTQESRDREAIDAGKPTPNTGYVRSTVDDPTISDPEGDLAPMTACRRGEVEQQESGKFVCVPADRVNPNSTMTGR